MRRKTSRRNKLALLGSGKIASAVRRNGHAGLLKGLTKGLITASVLKNGKKKAKKMYVVVSNGVKEHPYRSLGYITLGMGILSTLYLWQHFHTHSHK